MINVESLGIIDVNESDKNGRYYNISFLLKDTEYLVESIDGCDYSFATKYHQWVMYDTKTATIYPYRNFGLTLDAEPVDTFIDNYGSMVAVYDVYDFGKALPDDMNKFVQIAEYVRNDEVQKEIERLIVDSMI